MTEFTTAEFLVALSLMAITIAGLRHSSMQMKRR